MRLEGGCRHTFRGFGVCAWMLVSANRVACCAWTFAGAGLRCHLRLMGGVRGFGVRAWGSYAAGYVTCRGLTGDEGACGFR